MVQEESAWASLEARRTRIKRRTVSRFLDEAALQAKVGSVQPSANKWLAPPSQTPREENKLSKGSPDNMAHAWE